MDFHLPALTRYLAETGTTSPRTSGPTERASQRDPKQASEVTQLLSEQFTATNPPARLPKAIEAYFVGPAARGYHPIDADAQYTVPFNKSPPRPPASTSLESDPNVKHNVRPVGRTSAPLALGPPRHSSLQSGQLANTITAAVNTTPLDWSFLFGFPPPPSPQHPGARSSLLPASVATFIRPVKLGSNGFIGEGGGGTAAIGTATATAATAAAAAATAAAAAVPLPATKKKGVLGQFRKQATTSETGSGIFGRRVNPSVAAMPPTPEAKFCSAVMNVMERLAATQSIQTGRYRSLRLQAAEHREAIISTVSMPPPPKTGAFSSKAAANRMATVLQRSGASLDDMQAIVQQIQQFKGLSDDLRTAVAQQFQLFSYPPGSYLYEQDCLCDEAFVLISGTVMLHAEGRPPHRLQAGTILGVELMLRRHPVPLSVTTDPHFEAQLAVLSWHAYEATVRRWAADKVCALMPELQASQVARLKAGLMRGVSYAQRQPGEALYVGGQPTENVVLLVQGQVLIARPLESNALVTQAQMVSLLRVMMGPFANSMVLNEMPRMAMVTRGGLRGGLKSGQRPSIGPSGSVRLSGDSGGDAGGGSGSGGSATAEAAAAVSGGSRHHGSDSGAAAGRMPTHKTQTETHVSVSPWSMSGEDGEDESGHAGDSRQGGFVSSGDNSGEQAPPPPQRESLVRALRNSQNRNSRRGIEAAVADGNYPDGGGGGGGPAAEDGRPPPHPLSMPSVDITSREAAGRDGVMGRSDIDAVAGSDGGSGSDSELDAEQSPELAESAAAAVSRVSRISLRFADGSEASGADSGANAEAAGEPSTAEDPRVKTKVGEQPGSSLSPQHGVPELSLLPVVSAIDLAADLRGGAVHQPKAREKPLGSIASSGVIVVESSFGPGDVSNSATLPRASFVFGDERDNVATEYGNEPLTPAIHRLPASEAPAAAAAAAVEALPQAAVAEGLAVGDLSCSDSGSGDSGVAAVVATEHDNGGGFDGATLPSELTSAPEAHSGAATDPRPAPGGAATPLLASTPSSPPLKSGLRSKISGVSAHIQNSINRIGSRGTIGYASGSTSPRSLSRTDSITKAAAAAAAGSGGSRGANGSRSDDSMTLSRGTFRTSSVMASPEGRTAIRPISQGMLSEGTGRPRRPSSPTSEAPSVDERRPDSTTLLEHPILPPPATSKLRIIDSDEEAEVAGGGANTLTTVVGGTTGPHNGIERNIGPPENGGGRSSSESFDADLARASMEGMPPTPPGQQPGQSPVTKFALPLPLQLPQQQSHGAFTAASAPSPQRQPPSRAATNSGVRVTAPCPDPDFDYSVARVGGGAMPGTGPSKPRGGCAGAGGRTSDMRTPRNMGLERTNVRGSGGGGGGGNVRKQKDADRLWSYTGSAGASAGSGVAPSGAATGASQPLANALASQCKLHQHRVVTVYGAPVVFCEEALSEPKESDTMKPTSQLAAHSAVALQRCEYILIPAALLRSLLPTEALPQLSEAAVAAQRRLVTVSGHTEDTGPVTWPAAADKIRDILATSTPGHRQPWQVELLASAFSHLPAFARLTWQVRLRVFQDLEYRVFEPGDHLDLAKLEVTECSPRPSETSRRKSSAATEGVMDVIRVSSRSGGGGDGGDSAIEGGGGGGDGGDSAIEGGGGGGDGGDSAIEGGTDDKPRSVSTTPRMAAESPRGDGSAAADAGPVTAGVRPTEGLPRISEAPSSVPSRSPSYVGDLADSGMPRWSSGEDDAAATSAPSHRTMTVVPPLQLEALSPSSKLPWAVRYGSHGDLDASPQPTEDRAGEQVTPAAVAVAAAATDAREVAELGQVASVTHLAFGGAAAPGPTVPGLSEDYSEPSVSTLPCEASVIMQQPLTQRSGTSSSSKASVSGTSSGFTTQPGEASGVADGTASYTDRRLSNTASVPHPVEALFNPLAEEPLIPSLALRQHHSSNVDGAVPPSSPFTGTNAEGALGADDGERRSSIEGAPSEEAVGKTPYGSVSVVQFPTLVDGELVESPKLLPSSMSASTSTNAGGIRRGETAGTDAETLDSEAPSLSPYSLGSAPLLTPNDGSLIAIPTLTFAESTPIGSDGEIVMTADDVTPNQSIPNTIVPARRSTEEPLRREAVAEKLDDRTYWCLSGAIVLEAVQVVHSSDVDADAVDDSISQPARPTSTTEHAASSPSRPSAGGSSQVTHGRRKESESESESGEGPMTKQLQIANPGDAFSGGALAEAATAAFSTPAAAAAAAATPPPLELQQQQLLKVLPLGSSVLRARVAEAAESASGGGGGTAGGAEVLCMSRTMFELLSNGIGRSVPPAVLPVLARHVDWLVGVDIQTLAADLAGHYRLEEHKQGTELLRAGEPAPVVFLVASGECVMRGPVVGLKEPGTVADMIDLATLREGATCGELSLLAARPLWYTLVVASQSAKVVSLDMPALRSWLLTSPLGRAAAADVVAAVAEVDIALYGRAVKQIAIQVMNEKLELTLFNGPMKKILLRILEDYGPELSAVRERQREREREQQQQQHDVKGPKEGKGAISGGGGIAGGSSSKRPRDIVLEGWAQVEAIAASLARPYDPQAQSWELIAQAHYNAARSQHTLYLDSLLAASQLTTQEDPHGHASGHQRIAMPAPGLIAEAMADPGPVRHARLYDIRTLPKDLRGSEVESSRMTWDCSYVPLHELTTMMGAQVHVKQAAALQMLRPKFRDDTKAPVAAGETEAKRLRAPSLPPPGTSAPVGASNYLLACKNGGSGDGEGAAAARQQLVIGSGVHPRTGASSACGSGAAMAPSKRTSAALFVPTAPWDAKGRLPRTRGGGSTIASIDDATSRSSSPSRFAVNRDKTAPSPSSWSLAPLDTLAGCAADNLSHAASCSSLALIDPDLRVQLDAEMLKDDPISPGQGYRDLAPAAAAAPGDAEDQQLGMASHDGPASGHKPLDSIPEERSGLPLPLMSPPPRALSSRTLPLLPPLLPPHDTIVRNPATRQSIPIPLVPAAEATVTTAMATAVMAGPAAATPPMSSNSRRGRMQPRTSSSPPAHGLDDPTRSFWVRDKLHDPQGLAETILADAAARAVGQTAAAAATASAARGGAVPPADEIAAAASGNAGANVLMAAGGRTGLPSGSRTTRLQPLRRNGLSRGVPGPGGAAATAAAAAAAAAGTARGNIAEGPGASAVPRSAGLAAPSTPQVDPEMLYVTLQLPEAPKILPEFPSAAAVREAAELEAEAERVAREARIAAAIAHHSTRPLRIRPDMKYVPQYLRQRQRAPVMPRPSVTLPEGATESWVVPSYSSEVGFQDGFYDENSQVIYFD